MDYKRQLAKENSKRNWQLIMKDAGSNPKKHAELVDIFLSEDKVMVQRVAQIIGITGEKKPHLIKPHLEHLIHKLFQNPIDAFKRNVLRIIQYIDLPVELEGKLFDIALTFLKSHDESIAIRVFSMTALRRICENHPELSQEIILTLKLILEENKSEGIQSRGKKELKNLQKIRSQIH